jgi:hypothetical protein
VIYEVSGRRDFGGADLFRFRVYALSRKRALIKGLERGHVIPWLLFDPHDGLTAVYARRLGSKWLDRVFIADWGEVVKEDLRKLMHLTALEALELAQDAMKRKQAIADLAAADEARLDAFVTAPVAPGARSRISPLGD